VVGAAVVGETVGLVGATVGGVDGDSVVGALVTCALTPLLAGKSTRRHHSARAASVRTLRNGPPPLRGMTLGRQVLTGLPSHVNGRWDQGDVSAMWHCWSPCDRGGAAQSVAVNRMSTSGFHTARCDGYDAECNR
jgi:hypothetical protein